MSETRAVLLDALGTLVELEPPAPLLRRELERRTGVDVGEGRAAAAITAEITYYLEHHMEGSDRAGVERLRDRCADEVLASLRLEGLDHATARAAMLAALRFRGFPDAEPALRALRARGMRLVAVSNWDASLPETLARTGLARWLDGTVSSAVVGAAKPDPAVFGAALELAGCRPAEAFHVGDSPEADVAGARAAGVAVALLDRAGALGDPPPGVPRIASLEALPSVIWPA